MPHCLTKTSPKILCLAGPILPVRICLPDAFVAVGNATKEIIGTALIDTGSNPTCISKNVVQQLGLETVGKVNLNGVAGSNEHRLYRVTFDFLYPDMASAISIPDTEVVETNIDAQELIMLIGRDILSNAAFTYDGTTGIWQLQLPRIAAPVLPEED